ncbi:hypothetical protein ACFL35_18315 [Candidatus Riflebacteria bacterium]
MAKAWIKKTGTSTSLVEILFTLGILSLVLTGIYQTFTYVQKSFRMDNEKKALNRDLQRCTSILLQSFKLANPNFGLLLDDGLGLTPELDKDFFYYRSECNPLTEKELQVFDFTHYKEDGASEIIQGFLLEGEFFLTRQNHYQKKRLLSNIISFRIECKNRYQRKNGQIAFEDDGKSTPAGAILSLDIECLTNTGRNIENEKRITQSFKVNLRVPAVKID